MWVCVAYFLDAEAVQALKGVTHRLFDHERSCMKTQEDLVASGKLAGYLRPERR